MSATAKAPRTAPAAERKPAAPQRRASPAAVSGIVRETLPHRIAERIRDLIAQDAFKPGDKLAEQSLSEQLAVSRTPLREALKILAGEGLVQLLPNRGAFVADPDPQEVEEMLEALAGLEALSGRLACERATDAEIAALRALHEQMVQAYRRSDRLAYFKLNQRVHEDIATAARNRTVQRLRAQLNARLYRVRFLSNRTDRWHTAITEHEQITRALEKRNADKVATLLHSHLRHTWTKVRDAVAKR